MCRVGGKYLCVAINPLVEYEEAKFVIAAVFCAGSGQSTNTTWPGKHGMMTDAQI